MFSIVKNIIIYKLIISIYNNKYNNTIQFNYLIT